MDITLDGHLAERSRWEVPVSGSGHGPGEFVLYWMHNAVRGHENPALDVAITLASQNGLPLLVYHGLCETYPFASDRHHAFILQGARDVQRELGERGIAYAFHLQRQGCRGPHLRDLTRRAAVLVTEEMPVPPLTLWIERLRVITSTPIVCVDTACVVPPPLVGRPFTRAYEYRRATGPLYAERVPRAYREQEHDCEAFGGALPFEPLDLQRVCFATLIGQCRIDHTVGPVAETVGGTRSGYARWESFKRHGIRGYAKRRNNAADHGGTSRMSAYLHYGMVSPLRLAREADEMGAEKYLDELLVWRELAYHFCFHHGDAIGTLESIPPWARESLESHAGDARPENHSWETLARARTRDPLWDACQRSLTRHGELHNNVRMTWGKALPLWTDSPLRALQTCIDLNHRYALDGRDPASYGGILWCFGQFDRPFSPESPVLGRVRTRSLDDHRRRIDLPRFSRLVDRPLARRRPEVAIVGAGVAGLVAARTLTDHGFAVRVFEKSRGVGGRLASRRIDPGPCQTDSDWPHPGAATIGLDSFDHGTQYFTARDPRFMRLVQSWQHDGIVEPWLGRIVEIDAAGHIAGEKRGTVRYVGVPAMNSLAKHLANGLDVVTETRIGPLERTPEERWKVADESGIGQGEFDVVIVNAPPPQAEAVIGQHSVLSERVARIKFLPCWSVMLRARPERSPDFDAAFVNDGPLSWIARNDRKPGRGSGLERPDHAAGRSGMQDWVLHARPEWSETHLESAPEEAATRLLAAFESAAGIRVGEPLHIVGHRWRFARPANPLPEDCLWDPTVGLGACGDWCGGPRLEGAFLSGAAIAGAVLRHTLIDRAPAAKRDEAETHPTLF